MNYNASDKTVIEDSDSPQGWNELGIIHSFLITEVWSVKKLVTEGKEDTVLTNTPVNVATLSIPEM